MRFVGQRSQLGLVNGAGLVFRDCVQQAVIFGTPKLIGNSWFYEDVSGNERNVQIVKSSVGNMDGVIALAFADLSGITITRSVGTSTPSISGNNINFTAGTISELELSNGSLYIFAESEGNFVYDISGNNMHGMLTGMLNGFWGLADNEKPDNIIYGFDEWRNDTTNAIRRVPLRKNRSSILTDGDVLTGYTWIRKSVPGFNGAESRLRQVNDDMRTYDINNFWYDSSNNPREVTYAEVVQNVGDMDRILADTKNEPLKRRLITQDGTCMRCYVRGIIGGVEHVDYDENTMYCPSDKFR